MECPDQLTPVAPSDLFRALFEAWSVVFNEIPQLDSIFLALAHWALETGYGKSCHNFNLGNVKSRDGDGFDYTYFECGEELPASVADAHAVGSDLLVKQVRRYATPSGEMVSVRILPKHPWCRFRAYPTLEMGAGMYLSLLHTRFTAAWPALVRGDATSFVTGLKHQGYFTAPLAQYMTGVQSCLRRLKESVKVDPSTLPTLTWEDQQATMAHVAVSLDALALELAADSGSIPEES